MSDHKRVACFYRVSTKGQLDGDDIPMQKRACRDFIEKQGWVLVKEYTEKGVSGFKVSANDRDEIQRAKNDAENKLYDILLCFMFDRLGRREDETPFVLKWFSKKGVELWSVKEGQQKFEDHSDDLINFIRFWQSSGESKKTSIRVNEKHEQMVKDGAFRGGKPPYGYKLEKSGIINKKGKELLKLVIDEDQSKVIQSIYQFVHDEGWGSNRIAKYLNDPENQVPSYTGGKWNTGAINFILRNPIYKGYITYGKRKANDGNYEMQSRENWIMAETANPELIIVSEQIWDKVQTIRSSRSPDKVKNDNIVRYNVTKSPLLLVGNIYCGHCGSPLTTTYNSKKYHFADGTLKKWSQAKYRCSGKALSKTECDGQTIYAQPKIENSVLEEIEEYLEQLRQVDFTNEINRYIKKNVDLDEKEVKRLQKELEKNYSELGVLKSEITKSILGQSHFKPEMLSGLIDEKEQGIITLNRKIEESQNNIKSKKVEVNEMEELKKTIPEWKVVFESASHDKKKMMLNSIIDKVTVYKDEIALDVKLNIQQFISTVHGSAISKQGSPSESKILPYKFLSRSFKIQYSA